MALKFVRTTPELVTKRKKTYAEILRTKSKKKRKLPHGFQEVPMDIDKINASLTAANS